MSRSSRSRDVLLSFAVVAEDKTVLGAFPFFTDAALFLDHVQGDANSIHLVKLANQSALTLGVEIPRPR